MDYCTTCNNARSFCTCPRRPAQSFKLYDVTCSHSDGSFAMGDGLTVNDLHCVVDTLDNLLMVEMTIRPHEES